MQYKQRPREMGNLRQPYGAAATSTSLPTGSAGSTGASEQGQRASAPLAAQSRQAVQTSGALTPEAWFSRELVELTAPRRAHELPCVCN